MHCGLDHKEYKGGDLQKLYTIVLFILHSTVSRCFSKDNLVLRVIPGCLWDVACITLLLLITSGGCDTALDFRLKMTSCACLFLDLG